MYIRLALKERGKHWKLFIFIILQLAITFVVAICCVSVLDKQYERYSAYKTLMGKDGWFIHTNLGLRVPEIDAGTGKTGLEILQKYLKSTNIICSYSIFGEMMQDDYVLDIESIVYDNELIEIMNPVMAEGRWFEANSSTENEIEAVISPNYYGLETGDIVYLASYFAEDSDELIPVRIVGVLDENADVMKMNYSEDMISYYNFSFNIKDRLEIPLLIIQQEDIARLSLDCPPLKEILWPQGLLFIQYNDNITNEEKIVYDDFIENNMEIAIKEPLPTIKEKSILYIKEQISLILPVFFVFLIMTTMSTICVSVLVVKLHIKNLYIYRIVGIDKRGCFLIQFFVNAIVLCESVIVTFLTYLIFNVFRINIIFLEFGIWQMAICVFITVFWLGTVYMIQKKMLADHELWRIKRS